MIVLIGLSVLIVIVAGVSMFLVNDRGWGGGPPGGHW